MNLKIIHTKFFSALLLLLVSTLLLNVKSQSPDSAFESANKLYIEKKYDNAAKAYEKIIQSGNKSAEIYFNLGNAYFKTGNMALAILNYERAKRLDPADDDIAFNLQLASLSTIDKIEPAPQVFYIKWWNDFVNSSSISDHTQKGLLFIWIAFALAILYLFVNNYLVKRIAFFAALIMLFLGGFTLFLSQKQYLDLHDRKTAVIMSSGIYIKSSPDENSINLFMLHSGTSVQVVDELQGWKRIRIANGNEGWIPAGSIEVI